MFLKFTSPTSSPASLDGDSLADPPASLPPSSLRLASASRDSAMVLLGLLGLSCGLVAGLQKFFWIVPVGLDTDFWMVPAIKNF